MNAEELMKKIITSEGDEDGIHDRFGTNAELYSQCFWEFMSDINFGTLDDAISKQDYKMAFDSAHALKGTAGNLGITSIHKSLSLLVESLRIESDVRISVDYQQVLNNYRRLKKEFSDTDDKVTDTVKTHDRKVYKSSSKKRSLFLFMVAVIVVVVVVVVLFNRINVGYRQNVIRESAQHLIKIGNQLRLYVEEHLDKNWLIANSIKETIVDGRKFDDDAAVRGLISRKMSIWDVNDVILFTEDGYNFNSEGEAKSNDRASAILASAIENGRDLTIVESSLYFTVSLETDLTYRDEKIVALTVVQDMATLLDDMNISYYDSTAAVYLTMENGIIVSRLSNEATASVFNFKSIINGHKTETLEGEHTTEQMFTSDASVAYTMSDGDKTTYVVASPINAGTMTLRLFYLEPEAVVNAPTNDFSDKLAIFSFILILIFIATAFGAFMSMYRDKKKSFDQALVSRERMLDLMIKNTKTAFALFNTDLETPEYYSSNSVNILGDTYWTLSKTDSGYCIRNNTNTPTRSIMTANEMLGDWDGKSPFRSGYIRYGKESKWNYFVFQLFPVDDKGKEYVYIAQDITAMYEREVATKEAMDLAKRSNDAKSRFISNVSHDIRTPMNAIVNMTTFAQENIDQPKKLAVYLQTIRESGDHLLHLINDVLDMSRIERGQTILATDVFDIKDEIVKQGDMIKALCLERRQTLFVNTDGIKDSMVIGDRLKLSQILMNLLSNAVKFTPVNGAVRLTATEVPSLTQDTLDIRIKVEDTGVGIAQNDIDKVFEPFFRTDDTVVSQIEGTGLGLSICKSYVDAMGGSIHCESELGEGTIFTVELFFRKSDAVKEELRTEAVVGNSQFLGMHCLVVEDNATNRTIAKTMLERIGFIVDLADNGKTGLDMFLESKAYTYDVIYMDVQMPVMDGYRATAEIRKSSHPRARTVPIVALTANAFMEDVGKVRSVGMNAYVGKPITLSELITQTELALNKKR